MTDWNFCNQNHRERLTPLGTMGDPQLKPLTPAKIKSSGIIHRRDVYEGDFGGEPKYYKGLLVINIIRKNYL